MMPKIKDMILENWHLKLMAILLAGILWLFIQGEPGTVTTVTAPVQVQVPGGMEISRGLPSTVQVIIRGTVGDLTCNINLQNTQEGETRVTLTRDNIRSPKGLGIEVIEVVVGDDKHIRQQFLRRYRRRVQTHQFRNNLTDRIAEVGVDDHGFSRGANDKA